jgi:hypothetical protein
MQLLSVFTLYYRQDVITSSPIESEEFHSAEYKICSKVGKAVIVSNFMGEYNPLSQSKNPECRGYASEDCKDLEALPYKINPVLRCHHWDNKKWPYKTGDLLKEV